jgi:hypothetical protein
MHATHIAHTAHLAHVSSVAHWTHHATTNATKLRSTQDILHLHRCLHQFDHVTEHLKNLLQGIARLELILEAVQLGAELVGHWGNALRPNGEG